MDIETKLEILDQIYEIYDRNPYDPQPAYDGSFYTA